MSDKYYGWTPTPTPNYSGYSDDYVDHNASDPNRLYEPTAWDGRKVEEMWTWIQNSSDEKAMALAEMWHRASRLLESTRENLKKHGDALAAKWKSPAGEMFMEKVGAALHSFDEWKDVADRNASGLEQVARKIAKAQQDFRPLWIQYQKKQKEEQDDSKTFILGWFADSHDDVEKEYHQRALNIAKPLAELYIDVYLSNISRGGKYKGPTNAVVTNPNNVPRPSTPPAPPGAPPAGHSGGSRGPAPTAPSGQHGAPPPAPNGEKPPTPNGPPQGLILSGGPAAPPTAPPGAPPTAPPVGTPPTGGPPSTPGMPGVPGGGGMSRSGPAGSGPGRPNLPGANRGTPPGRPSLPSSGGGGAGRPNLPGSTSRGGNNLPRSGAPGSPRSGAPGSPASGGSRSLSGRGGAPTSPRLSGGTGSPGTPGRPGTRGTTPPPSLGGNKGGAPGTPGTGGARPLGGARPGAPDPRQAKPAGPGGKPDLTGRGTGAGRPTAPATGPEPALGGRRGSATGPAGMPPHGAARRKDEDDQENWAYGEGDDLWATESQAVGPIEAPDEHRPQQQGRALGQA